MASVGILQFGDVIDQQQCVKKWEDFQDCLPNVNRRAVEKLFGNLRFPDLHAASVPVSREVFVEVAHGQEEVVWKIQIPAAGHQRV